MMLCFLGLGVSDDDSRHEYGNERSKIEKSIERLRKRACDTEDYVYISGMIVQNLANFIRFIASTYIKLELRFRFNSMFTSKSAQVSKLISCDELNSLVFKQLLFESILSLIESFRIETFEHLGIFTNIL